MNFLIRIAALAAVLGAAGGCAVAPLQQAADGAAARVDERIAAKPAWSPVADAAEPMPELREPLTLPAAIALAFTRNPDIRRQYARLGIAHADLQDAARIANPTLSLAWLDPNRGTRDQTTRGISASFTDLLLLPARRRLSAADFRRTELAVAADLVALAHEVETAWYSHLGARQTAAMRQAVAQAAELEASLARRYHEAGNMSRLALDLQLAAVAQARIDELRAQSDAAAARARLANLLGLKTGADWSTVNGLPAPPDVPLSRDALLEQALAQRLDLAAAREEVATLEDVLRVTGRWRLLGSVEAGYERERELDGTIIRGPTLSLELPLFNQGQGAISRAEARLLDAGARRDALILAVENEVVTGIERLAAARQTSEQYRDALLPSAVSAVAGRQREFNFMLEGAFELIRAKREEYNAWQAYFESLRDYWIARTALRTAVGGSLPGDGDPQSPAIGARDIVAPAANAADEAHERHEQHGEQP